MNENDDKDTAVCHNHRVLVVDDDRTLRFHARQVLETYGLAVEEAEDGAQALRQINTGSFDAVLLDVRMPGMDGFTACREMRRQTGGEFLPIIVVTGQDDSEAIERAFQSGATDFVTKPVNWLKLKNRMRYLMNARTMAKDLASTRCHRNALLHTIPDNVLRLTAEGEVLDFKPAYSGLDLRQLELRTGVDFHDADLAVKRRIFL